MSIKKGKDIKLNVQPIMFAVYHEYVFEGPCRFGEGEQLTKEFDMMRIATIADAFNEEVASNLNGVPFVNVLDPLVIKRDETFPITDDILAECAAHDDEADIYLVKFHPFGIDLALAMAQKVKKPMCSVLQCCNDTGMVAALRPRGCEAFGWASWEDAIEGFKVLRARKVLRNTRVLAVPRNNSDHSLSALDSFYRHEDITDKLGVEFRYYNLHEFLDQTKNVDPTTNPTLPGRKADNINDEDEAIIRQRVEEFMAGADECDMSAEDIFPSMKANYLVNKLMDKLDCNAFTAPCPDMCATRRLNEGRFTLCLNHSLNNENGICSACEYDLSALISMVFLSNLSFSAPYMGNTSVGKLTSDSGLEVSPLLKRNGDSYAGAVDAMEKAGKIAYTFHAVPNRKLFGFDAEQEPYAIRPFAMGGRWGATIRYDFAKDAGNTVTMARFDPLCEKIFICRGTIVSGIGYKDENCTEGVFFEVDNAKKFHECQLQVGNHVPLVYGDHFDNAVALAKLLGLEVLTIE